MTGIDDIPEKLTAFDIFAGVLCYSALGRIPSSTQKLYNALVSGYEHWNELRVFVDFLQTESMHHIAEKERIQTVVMAMWDLGIIDFAPFTEQNIYVVNDVTLQRFVMKSVEPALDAGRRTRMNRAAHAFRLAILNKEQQYEWHR